MHKTSQFSRTPVFSTPYIIEFEKIKKVIKKYLPVLTNDPIYAQISSNGIQVVPRRAPTLGRWLSPSLYTSE